MDYIDMPRDVLAHRLKHCVEDRNEALAQADAHISTLIQKLAWIVDDWHSPLWNTQEGQELMSMLRTLKNLPAPEPSRLWARRCQRVEATRDDLLAACEAVLANGFREIDMQSWAAPLVAQLRAAIAKATDEAVS